MDRGSQLSKDDEDDEEEEERRTRQEEAEEEEKEEEEEEEATDIKSNNPHLAGGEQNIQFLRDCQPQAAACTSSSLSFSVCVFCLGTSQWQSAMSQSMTSILSPSRNKTNGKMEHIQLQYIPIGTTKAMISLIQCKCLS